MRLGTRTLRSLSFVEQGPYGLDPHDLAREVLDADLRWRDREEYGGLHERIRTHVLARIRTTTGREQQRALLDFMYLHRTNPFAQPFWEWASFDQTYSDPVTPVDHARGRPGHNQQGGDHRQHGQ